MFIVGIAPRVEAGFSPSEAAALSKVDRAAELEQIQKALETKMIKERLGKLGLTQEEVNKRLSQLDDRQIHQLALKIDDLRVAGNGFEVFVAFLLIGILVGVWFYVTGHRVVVTK
jgi:predicted flavoprotein YhiN